MKAGDAIKVLTEKLGIEQCEPCKERQATLNAWSDRLAELLSGKKGKTDGKL